MAISECRWKKVMLIDSTRRKQICKRWLSWYVVIVQCQNVCATAIRCAQ